MRKHLCRNILSLLDICWRVLWPDHVADLFSDFWGTSTLIFTVVVPLSTTVNVCLPFLISMVSFGICFCDLANKITQRLYFTPVKRLSCLVMGFYHDNCKVNNTAAQPALWLWNRKLNHTSCSEALQTSVSEIYSVFDKNSTVPLFAGP